MKIFNKFSELLKKITSPESNSEESSEYIDAFSDDESAMGEANVFEEDGAEYTEGGACESPKTAQNDAKSADIYENNGKNPAEIHEKGENCNGNNAEFGGKIGNCSENNAEFGGKIENCNGNNAENGGATVAFSAFESVVSEAEREEYILKFRKDFMRHFPRSLDTVECHMRLPYMVGCAVDVSSVIAYASEEVYSKYRENPEKLAEVSRAAVAKVAVALEKNLSERNLSEFVLPLERAFGDSLEKAWIVLDFYQRMMNSDYTENICGLYRLVTNELISRCIGAASLRDDSTYEQALERCVASVSGDDAQKSAKATLIDKLCELERIYVFHDESFNSRFPYIGADGRIEIQTDAERAKALERFLEKNKDCQVSIREYRQEEFGVLFNMLLHNGLTVLRLENGYKPVEVDFEDMCEPFDDNLIELCNRYARGRFISELQYGYRLKNLFSDRQDSEAARLIIGAMRKARSDGYRALAGGLCYALVPNIQGKGATLYTDEALRAARMIMKKLGIIDEGVLVSPCDRSYDVYEGELALCTSGSGSAGGCVYAFTDYDGVKTVRARLEKIGIPCTPIVLTLPELCRASANCDGFVLDTDSYGLEVPSDRFQKIIECVKEEGMLVNGKEL